VRVFSLLLAAALVACASSPEIAGQATPQRADEIRLLLTSDEHGWLEPWKDRDAGKLRGGVQLLKAHLLRDGLGGRNVAAISGGDNWTGPYTSTTLKGAPMVAAMNAIGYRASVLGNHEFDFGVRELARRSAEARFPILSANLYQEAARGLPRWIEAGALLDVGGRRVGVVGLSTRKTPETTDPRHVVGHTFGPYEDALRAVVPSLREQGAEEVIVVLHDGLSTGLPLAPVLRELKVAFVALGHQHDAVLHVDDGGTPEDADDITFCNPGGFTRSYCVVDLALRAGAPARVRAEIKEVSAPVDAPLPSDPELTKILAAASAMADKLGDEKLADAPDGLTRERALGQFVVDSWLHRFPDVDVAISNRGGFRQDIAPGPLRVRDVISAMPFANYLVIVELTGAQLAEALASKESVFGGARAAPGATGNLLVLDSKGKRIGSKRKVRVVINDFIYRGGDGFRFREWDEEPEETSVDWRDPVFQKLRELTAASETVKDRPDARDRR
jgi:5'-nucleotidase